MIFNLPNLVSMSRIVIAPIFMYLLMQEDSGYIYLACILFIVGAFTDYLDGWLARKFNMVSSWGVFFDPLADKILTTAAFLAFAMLDIIPLWMVIIIIIRDIGTTVLRVVADNLELSVTTSKAAKLKTLLQMFYISYILLLILFKAKDIFFASAAEADQYIYSSETYIMMLLLTAYTVWTFLEYLYHNRNVVRKLLN